MWQPRDATGHEKNKLLALARPNRLYNYEFVENFLNIANRECWWSTCKAVYVRDLDFQVATSLACPQDSSAALPCFARPGRD